VEVLRPSPDRVNPPCPAFGRCGGCEWQHLPYHAQWKTKKEGVRHALSRVEVGTAHLLLEELPAEQVWEYRNRIQLRGFRDELGFYERGSKKLVAIEKCHIARPELNVWLEDVKAEGRRKPREYKAELEVFPDGVVTLSWNARHSSQGFRQVHDAQNEKLRAWVALQLNGAPVLLDLYGGSGNLSLGLAERFGEIHCVDVSAPQEKTESMPASFFPHRSAVLPWLKAEAEKLKAAKKIDIILDPPREGLGPDLAPIVEILKSLPVGKILLIGCDVDSWARAVARFLRHGWKLSALGALDFFPQTHHVEALGVLDRDAASGGPEERPH
jgi:tRNA/tmRNA/rRNA uracil-C5-methylase (TrmA/RlmC/RlmD family)